jgi:hypothetical protein
MHLHAHKLDPQPTDCGMTRRTCRLAWIPEAKLPHLECHGKRAELKQGTARESTADVPARGFERRQATGRFAPALN